MLLFEWYWKQKAGAIRIVTLNEDGKSKRISPLYLKVRILHKKKSGSEKIE